MATKYNIYLTDEQEKHLNKAKRKAYLKIGTFFVLLIFMVFRIFTKDIKFFPHEKEQKLIRLLYSFPDNGENPFGKLEEQGIEFFGEWFSESWKREYSGKDILDSNDKHLRYKAKITIQGYGIESISFSDISDRIINYKRKELVRKILNEKEDKVNQKIESVYIDKVV